MRRKPLETGDAVQVIGPSSDSSTFAIGDATTVVDIRTADDEDAQTAVYACPIHGWGVVNFPASSLVPMMGSMYRWEVGDTVWLRMGDSQRPAVITQVGTDYGVEIETHDDGYMCQQYMADVTFSHGVYSLDGIERDVQVSHCMLTAREDGK